jgi:anti-sigma factor RsiW
MSAHLEDDVELYALGLCDDDARRRIERHAAECASCAGRMAQALEAGASLASALPRYLPSSALARRIADAQAGAQPRLQPLRLPWRVAAAFAAACVLTLAGVGQERSWERARAEQTALRAIVASHFLHRSLTRTTDLAPSAKVLYAPDGSWIYLLVNRPAERIDVEARIGGARRILGHLARADGVVTLFVRDPGRIDALELRDAGGLEAFAELAY